MNGTTTRGAVEEMTRIHDLTAHRLDRGTREECDAHGHQLVAWIKSGRHFAPNALAAILEDFRATYKVRFAHEPRAVAWPCDRCGAQCVDRGGDLLCPACPEPDTGSFGSPARPQSTWYVETRLGRARIEEPAWYAAREAAREARAGDNEPRGG